ncbi:MAG: DUF3253 domain-containing protein [Pseudomonadota bacterium]
MAAPISPTDPDAKGSPTAEEISAVILALTRTRGPEKSICPSEAARALVSHGADDDAWRPLMPAVRAQAVVLARTGAIEITQKGSPVPDLDAIRGAIRLRLARDDR